MGKQILIVTLWAVTGLYLGAIFARVTGTSGLIGPLLAIVLAALVVRLYVGTTPGRVRRIADRAEASVSGPVAQTTPTVR